MNRVLNFLNDLRENNNREWFAANKARYVAANEVFNEFAAALIAEIGAFDPLVRGLTVRDCTYRIYRDTRFSKDKTPYKTHFGAYVCPGGKKSGNAGYYFHVEPVSISDEKGGMIGGCLLDAGVYMPEPAVLRSVRDEIFDNGQAILTSAKKAATTGFELDTSNSLSRTPKGFPSGSEHDNLLRLKDLHLAKFVDDDYVLAPNLAKRVASDFRATHQFMTIVQRAVDFAHECETARAI